MKNTDLIYTDMAGTILTAVLGCVGRIIGSGIGTFASLSKINSQLEQLGKEVEKNNHLVIEMVAVKEQSKSYTHRFDA